MLVNITHDTKGEHARLFGAGVAFITVIALLVGLSIAIYQKAFSDPTMVTIKAQNAGLQLAKFGDVRRHGALVGHVRDISNDGTQAVIKVALVPFGVKIDTLLSLVVTIAILAGGVIYSRAAMPLSRSATHVDRPAHGR